MNVIFTRTTPMTVKDLIEILKWLPGDATVVFVDAENSSEVLDIQKVAYTKEAEYNQPANMAVLS